MTGTLTLDGDVPLNVPGATAGQVLTSDGSGNFSPQAGGATSAALTAETSRAEAAEAAAQAAAIAASLPTLTVATASASATLAVNKLTQVTAASNLTMTLPSPVAGALIVVEREAASAGTVAVTGNIRGAGSSTVTLSLASESEAFLGTASTWDPVAGHKTLGSLQGLFAGKPATTTLVAYVSKTGSDSNDGLSWGSSKLTVGAGLALLPAGGVLSVGPGDYLESGLAPASNTIMRGAGNQSPTRTRIAANATSVSPSGDLFAVPSSCQYCVFEDIAFSSGTFNGGGHIYNASTASLSNCVWNRCSFSQANDGNCIVYTTDATFINNTFRNCFSSHTATATVPSWWLVSSTGGIESNTWENIWHTLTGNYAILINSTSASTYSSGHVFKNFTWEECTGGLIRLQGVRYSRLENLVAYDNSGSFTTILNDGYYLGLGGGGLSCWGIDVTNVQRLAGTLNSRTDTGCGTTLNSTTVTDSSAVTADAGRQVTNANIPAGTTIVSVTGGTGYVLSAPATATASSQSFVIQLAVDIRCAALARGSILTCSGVIDLNSKDVLTSNLLWFSAATAVLNRSATQSIDISPVNGSTFPSLALSTPLPLASGGTGQASAQAALNALAASHASGNYLRGNGTNVLMSAIQAADLPAGTTSAQGALQLDGTTGDIKALGSVAAGASGKAADASHVHPTTGIATIDSTAGDIKAPSTAAAAGAAGLAADASHVHPLNDPLAMGMSLNFLPGPSVTTVTWSGANNAYYYRLLAAVVMANAGFIVGVSSGNVSTAIYTTSGSAQGATPTGGQIATSGAVACPATGNAVVSLGGTFTPVLTGWIALSCDNATATFEGVNGTTQAMLGGLAYTQATAHPLPSTPSSLGAGSNARYVFMRGQ